MPELSINGVIHSLAEADLVRSLLDVLRLECGLTGTKEGCGTGDCGACTIVADDGQGSLSTLNSCITPTGALLGKRILTVEGLTPIDGSPHPVQTAMIEEHGSQCGFCTPGFVMSIFAHQLNSERSTREEVITAISGNLCRCTGYRPIIDAAIAAEHHPERAVANARLVELPETPAAHSERYVRPDTEADLVAALARVAKDPDSVAVAAGTTDKWLEYTQGYRDFDWVLDLGALTALREIEETESEIRIGAMTSHATLMRFFEDRPAYADVVTMLKRFGSPQIRGRGTIGGNIANASPVADWPPVLLALGASVTILDSTGTSREIPLDEFYLGYKETALQADEVIRSIVVRKLDTDERLYVRKITKRYEDDISTILCAARLSAADVQVAFGGMAATPVKVDASALIGELPDPKTAVEALISTLNPISDVRSSADYRSAMAVALLREALEPGSESIFDV